MKNKEQLWNMDHGSLAKMNPTLNPRTLQVGQTIRTTLNESDLPEGVTLHSANSMNGMDGFFRPNAEGVNKIYNVSEVEFNTLVLDLASGNPLDAAWGHQGDAKMQYVNNQEQYSNDAEGWVSEQNSVTEPATRYLFVYKGYGYNINEFGNVVFGAANSKKGNIGITLLLLGGHVYSIFANGQLDEASEVQAVTRGYNYYPGFQHPSSEEAPFMP